ncbi:MULTISPECIES: NADPH-dependent FMN reductase [Mycobacteriaceae]|uniref:NAD(P)H-dependent oxidoreductase n=1 Tax=Mycolicibacterium austroafricanum TaxID=39687 RepID=A0ABT8H8W0_MYCAO|nr:MULTISPECIES: NAD(P)H-dependent oxidoreductase [Mycobacteriaceae]MDN4517197.1 NAD(P)H-dependent oxidoreductase [Mycolicibacterium austroafricanum]
MMQAEPAPLRLAVVTGSTRPHRRSAMVAEWVHQRARAHFGEAPVQIDLIDLAEVDLPPLDEPVPAMIGDYRHEHTRRWSQLISSYDGFVFVTPEHNHSMPAALKNAIDYLYSEWNNKAAGFVSLGVEGGTRAVEHLRLVLAEMKVACVRSQVPLGLFTDFEIDDVTQPGRFTPAAQKEELLNRMLDELVEWATALRTVRVRPGSAV